MQLASLLTIGFSFGAAALLLLGNLLQRREPVSFQAKAAGFLLLADLTALQWLHLQYLLGRPDAVLSKVYLGLLFGVAPSFYFYSRQLLGGVAAYRRRDVLHWLPFTLTLLSYHWAFLSAFAVGSGYLLWLCKTVYGLRGQRRRFHLELLSLAGLLAIAVAVIVLGLLGPLLDDGRFISVYSLLLGLAFFTVALTLLRFPNLAGEVSEAVQAAYAESTLKNIDKAAVLAKLDKLMSEDKLYTLEGISLAAVAEPLAISPHQLSELINTEFGQGFSRYIREHRVAAAKQLLLADPQASVLSIGLTVGFATQSNFYAAFKDVTGITPGQYRKKPD
ncbi:MULTISPECIES: helix-turn-helix domain-containing protein [Methylomonas]|uniref:helix-turn-helix domain-containing protein n=1 Tax=Methylomonas TaxID=416 RepID=UPI0012321B93|nr:helix-turn-helix domain-containing protein [Methylomonas rhizoryzae]